MGKCRALLTGLLLAAPLAAAANPLGDDCGPACDPLGLPQVHDAFGVETETALPEQPAAPERPDAGFDLLEPADESMALPHMDSLLPGPEPLVLPEVGN